MNLLHLADLHLGKRVNGFDLLPDQRYILEQVLDLCTAHNVQAVALAGDIYDTALPPAAAVLLLDWFLTELAHRNIPVLAIAGLSDDTVDPEWSSKIAAASANEASGTFFIEGMDHTFNVFTGDLTALYAAIDATGEFFVKTLR